MGKLVFKTGLGRTHFWASKKGEEGNQGKVALKGHCRRKERKQAP